MNDRRASFQLMNKEIAEKSAWTIEDIIERTDRLAAELLKIYALT